MTLFRYWLSKLLVTSESYDVLAIPPSLFQKWMQEAAAEREQRKARG